MAIVCQFWGACGTASYLPHNTSSSAPRAYIHLSWPQRGLHFLSARNADVTISNTLIRRSVITAKLLVVRPHHRLLKMFVVWHFAFSELGKAHNNLHVPSSTWFTVAAVEFTEINVPEAQADISQMP